MSPRPLRRRCDARPERRVMRSLRRSQQADYPPHRTWGPATRGSFGALARSDMRVACAEVHRVKYRGEEAFRIAARCFTAHVPTRSRARPRSMSSRISMSSPEHAHRLDPLSGGSEDRGFLPFRRTREGRRREKPRCDLSPVEGNLGRKLPRALRATDAAPWKERGRSTRAGCSGAAARV